MSKAKETPAKKTSSENKVTEPKTESSAKADNKSDAPAKTENKSETSTKTENKPDAKPKKQEMGEGQKAVSKAYKDNWNDIFAKKKKK